MESPKRQTTFGDWGDSAIVVGAEEVESLLIEVVRSLRTNRDSDVDADVDANAVVDVVADENARDAVVSRVVSAAKKTRCCA